MNAKREDLEFLNKETQLISKKLIAGNPLIHAYADEHPGYDFAAVKPNLEDVFFTKIMGIESFVTVLRSA